VLSAGILLALQAAAPTPSPIDRTGAEWSTCVKGTVDAAMRSDEAADALVTRAFDHCAPQEEAMRAAIAAERGDENAALNVERVRSRGRQLFLAYIARERGR
jgi:hypothetical protein